MPAGKRSRASLELLQKYFRLTCPSPSASIGLICHLVELFHSHASKHLQDVVPATFLFPALIAGQEVRPLLLAMCANCTRFSAHPAAGAHISGHDAVDAHFATSAQRLLVTRGLREIHHLNHIRTLCVLVEYEASQSRGRLSWAHIGKSPQTTTRDLPDVFWSQGLLAASFR